MRQLSARVLCISIALAACDKKADPPAPPTSAAPAGSIEAPPAAAPAAPSPQRSRPAQKLNVLLITIDSLRADMPWAGYDKAIAPHLTKLASESVVYEDYRSVSSYTAQTVATFLSGRYASTLYRTGTFFTNYFEGNEWMSEGMQKAGVRTMAVHAHLYFDRAPGLKQGFDVWQMVPGLTWNAQTDESVTSDKSVTAMIELLSKTDNTKGQFFLWSHLMDPHDQYVRHEEAPDFGKDNRGRYDSEVWFTDSQLGRLFEFAEKQPWWKDTVVIVSADHGEAFGEHGMYKHAFELWEVLTRIPLIVRAPGATPKRMTEKRSHIDLAPTVVDLLGLAALPGFQGASLLPEIYDLEPAGNREPILLELSEDTNNGARRALIAGDYKLIVWDGGAKKSLFNLKVDPGELKDLAGDEPDKLRELEAALKAKFGALPSIAPFGGNKLKSGKLATGPKGPAPSTAAEDSVEKN